MHKPVAPSEQEKRTAAQLLAADADSSQMFKLGKNGLLLSFTEDLQAEVDAVLDEYHEYDDEGTARAGDPTTHAYSVAVVNDLVDEIQDMIQQAFEELQKELRVQKQMKAAAKAKAGK